MTIWVKIRGHSYIIRGASSPIDIINCLVSWAANYELDFDGEDAMLVGDAYNKGIYKMYGGFE